MVKPQGKVSLERAEKVAAAVIDKLRPYCQKIEVAGSVRRRKPWVNDIDLVLIPSDLWQMHNEILRLGQGRAKMSGSKIQRIDVAGIQVDIYFATPETFATLLLIRTGSKESNIRLCSIAKKRGWHLAASGDGLFDELGDRVAGDSEESIYKALGVPYQSPERR